jgi:hypothetical protein
VGITYFLGAGASAADGLPLTSHLDFGIASFLHERGLDTPLGRYYNHAFCVTASDCADDAKKWRSFMRTGSTPNVPSKLPYIVETLSLLDVCIAEGSSLGPHQSKTTLRQFELSNAGLRDARAELVDAVRFSIVQAVRRVTRSMPATEALISRLKPGDTIVTTNWDYLLEKKLSINQRKEDGGWLKRRNVDFHCINERVTDWRGNDLRHKRRPLLQILKLHGGVNWYLCDRCQSLYINVEYMPASHDELVGDDGGCHCGARLAGLIVAPTYLKDYDNSHLRSVWIAAQKALQSSSDWVMVGYSLPPDDYHIRALLLRALCVRRTKSRGPNTRITVVTDGGSTCNSSDALRKRYLAFFRAERVAVFDGGFAAYLEKRRPR